MEELDTQALGSDQSVEDALLSAKRKMALIEEKAGLCKALLQLTGVESSLAGETNQAYFDMSSQRIDGHTHFDSRQTYTRDERSEELEDKVKHHVDRKYLQKTTLEAVIPIKVSNNSNQSASYQYKLSNSIGSQQRYRNLSLRIPENSIPFIGNL